MDYFVQGFKEYAKFSGRDRRQNYWMFVLIYMLIYIGLTVVDQILGTVFIASIFSLIMFIPSLSFAARRLHDTGRTGWWQLIILIPVIGLIVMIVFLAQDSEKEENAYGPSPKYT